VDGQHRTIIACNIPTLLLLVTITSGASTLEAGKSKARLQCAHRLISQQPNPGERQLVLSGRPLLGGGPLVDEQVVDGRLRRPGGPLLGGRVFGGRALLIHRRSTDPNQLASKSRSRGHFWSKRARPGQFWSKRSHWGSKVLLPISLTPPNRAMVPMTLTPPSTLPVSGNQPSSQVTGKLLQLLEHNRLRFGRK